MGFELLIRVISLLDIALVQIGGASYFVVIEGTAETRVNSQDQVQHGTIWHWWSIDASGISKVSDQMIYLPPCKSISLACAGDRLVGLLESNFKSPAILWEAAVSSDSSGLMLSEGELFAELRLTSSQQERFDIKPKDLWSSIGLTNKEWLFNPSIVCDESNGTMRSALNVATGDAFVMDYSRSEDSWRELAFVRGALEPVLLQNANDRYLLYRQVTDNWSIMYGSPRYSDDTGPVKLPLVLAKVDSSGKIGDSIHLSQLAPLGNVYTHGLDGNGAGRLAVAGVRGSVDSPVLIVLVSSESKEDWLRRGTFELPSVPERLALAYIDNEVVVANAVRNPEDYSVSIVKFAVPSGEAKQ